jgi:hypothetical protein
LNGFERLIRSSPRGICRVTLIAFSPARLDGGQYRALRGKAQIVVTDGLKATKALFTQCQRCFVTIKCVAAGVETRSAQE